MSQVQPDCPALTLVVNPAAGDGRAQRTLPQVCATLLQGLPGATLRVHQARDGAEARRLCREAVASARPVESGHRADALLVMGGDGIMHLGVNACAGTAVPLGIIPAGTGNDLARGLGIPMSPTAAAGIIVGGVTRRIDLLRLDGDLPNADRTRFAGTVLATGFDAAVNATADTLEWPSGSGRYLRALLREVRRFEPYRYRLRIDGRPRQVDAMLVAIGNTAYYGGGIKILPNALVDDGLLDITIIHPVSRATLVRLMPALYRGTFVGDPAVEMLRARVVEVDGERLSPRADGEPMGRLRLVASIAPGALDVLAPATVGA